MAQKIRVDTRKYVETFLCIPCIPCENYCTQTPQNCADALRNFAPLREIFSHRIHGKHRTIRGVIISRRRRRLSQKHVAQILWISVSVCNFFAILCERLPRIKNQKK